LLFYAVSYMQLDSLQIVTLKSYTTSREGITVKGKITTTVKSKY